MAPILAAKPTGMEARSRVIVSSLGENTHNLGDQPWIIPDFLIMARTDNPVMRTLLAWKEHQRGRGD